MRLGANINEYKNIGGRIKKQVPRSLNMSQNLSFSNSVYFLFYKGANIYLTRL